MRGDYYHGKSVLITGASSGIGAAMAEKMAAAGAKIALLARRADRLRQLRDRIKSSGGQAIDLVCDVRERASIDAAVAKTVDTFGGIDIAIANAGFGVAGLFQELDTEDYRRQFDVNFFGVIDTVYAVMPHLLKAKGHLAIVSSVAGRTAPPGTAPYAASKFALYGLAQSLYFEFSVRHVAITCIMPGFVKSEIRNIDNRGVYDPHLKDPVPEWLVVPTEKAAEEIFRRLPARKLEMVVTGHGKVLVWFSRHFPRTWLRIGRALARKNIKPRHQDPK